MSRTIRRPFRGSRAVDSTCRSHGGCPWCEKGRKHKNERRDPLPDHLYGDLGLLTKYEDKNG